MPVPPAGKPNLANGFVPSVEHQLFFSTVHLSRLAGI
jgi:hypothetical protein